MHGMHQATRVSGTITAVSGHLVTLQQARGTIVINDQVALNRKMTGNVAVGRQIVAVGHWRNGTFYATALQFGLATSAMKQSARVSGTITAVSGHLVTLQRSRDTIVINDQPALNHETTGNVAVGRQVVAHGYWRRGTFYATSMIDDRDRRGPALRSLSVPVFESRPSA
ncbi:MAG: hypothetical protein ACYDBO_10160 [Vulcanimicrobiaceae bacterium]